jgi:hypothetical protein
VATSARDVPIASARDYDPHGDGSENPRDAPLAIDGSTATAWTTSHYVTAAFGNLKDGVGLWLGLRTPATIVAVTIASPIDGWTFQLRGGPFGRPGSALQSADGATSFTVRGRSITVQLRAARTQGLLVWITNLGPDGGRFAAAIADVRIRAS